MSIDISKMSDTDLLNIDPMELSSEQLNRWEAAQKKAMRINRTYEAQLKYRVEQVELEARDFMAKRNIKVANLENMEATIKMEDLYEGYQSAIQKASTRVQDISKQFESSPSNDPYSKDTPEEVRSMLVEA